MKNVARVSIFLATVFTLTQVQAGIVTLFDGTFADADWELRSDGSAGGSGGSPSAGQFPVGGNPGEFRRNRNVSTVGGFNFKLTNSWNFNTVTPYDPSTEGAIESISYSEQSLAISGGTQTGTVALRQDGRLYRPLTTYTTTSSQTAWAPHSLIALEQSDFALYLFDSLSNQWLILQTANPDFSDSGSPIEFGHFRSNNAGNFGQYNVFSGIDNWQVELTTAEIPEPTSLLLMLCAAGVASGGRARKGKRSVLAKV